MTALNKQVNLPALQKTMADFQRQAESMEMKQEVLSSLGFDADSRGRLTQMMEDAMASLDAEEDEAESEQIVSAVLDSIGITLNEGPVSCAFLGASRGG